MPPVWSTTLPGAAVPGRCVQWNDEGQAAVLSSEAIYILTPAIGDAESPETPIGAHFVASIDARRELERYGPAPEAQAESAYAFA